MTHGSRSVAARPLSYAAFLAALAGMLVLSGCADATLGRPAAALVAGDGVEIARDGGWMPVGVGETLDEDTRLRTGEREAALRLAGGEIRLAPGSTALVHHGSLELVGGAALVLASDDLLLRWEDVEVTGTATYRLDAGVTPRVGVYDGDVAVRRLAEAAPVPALRELAFAPRRLADEPSPLQYRDGDPWDRRFLSRAFGFDEEIARLARGLDREYGTEPRDGDFYESFLAVEPTTVPVLASTSRVTDGRRFGPPSDALVTLFVARAVADARDGDLGVAARAVAALRGAGARWGLIAVEEGVGTRELARIVDLARERHVAVTPEDSVEVPEAPAGTAASEGPEAPAGEPPRDGGAAAGEGGRSPAGNGSGESGSVRPPSARSGPESGSGGAGNGGGAGGSGGSGNGGSDPGDPADQRLLRDTTDAVGAVIDDVVGQLSNGDDGTGGGGLLD